MCVYIYIHISVTGLPPLHPSAAGVSLSSLFLEWKSRERNWSTSTSFQGWKAEVNLQKTIMHLTQRSQLSGETLFGSQIWGSFPQWKGTYQFANRTANRTEPEPKDLCELEHEPVNQRF